MNSYETILNEDYLHVTFRFSKIYKTLDNETKQFIDYLIADYREKGNQDISISVKDYMVFRNLKSLEESWNLIVNVAENIFKLSFDYHGKNKTNCKFKTIKMRLMSDIEVKEDVIKVTMNKLLFNAILAIKEDK